MGNYCMINKVRFGKNSIGMDVCAELSEGLVVWVMFDNSEPIYEYSHAVSLSFYRKPPQKRCYKKHEQLPFPCMKDDILLRPRNNWNKIIVTIKSTTYLTILLKNMYLTKLPELNKFGSFQKGMDKSLQVIAPLLYYGAILFMLYPVNEV